MNLVASAILRGMIGASSAADVPGVPGNRRNKGRSDAPASENAAGNTGDTLRTAFDGEDAREAIKGTQTQAGLQEKSQDQESEGSNPFRAKANGTDSVRISDAGRSAKNAYSAQGAAQDGTKSAMTGRNLSIKV